MKNKNIIIGTVIVIVLILIISLIIMKKPKTEETQNKEETNLLKDYTKTDALFAYSGTYTKNNYIILINVSSKDDVTFSVTDGEKSSTINLELDKDNYLGNKEENAETEKFSIKISKTKEGIKVESSSKVEDSIFNELSNTYEELNVEQHLSGIYTNDKETIIIDEYDKDMLYISIESIGYYNYIERESTYTKNKYDDKSITLYEANQNNEEKVTIEKTEDGLKVSLKKSNKKSIFDNAVGTYEKLK